ncbi:DUF1877 family protein [Streptomyces sp. NPDC058770]|uniref:DUF1877 family protein n=1 Tax=Streptomyces sp. NPDC058770 TaxID=3346631 RepID=UPI0036B65F9E
MLLFTEVPEDPEPLWLWLNEQGLPLVPHSWNGVFATANRRCRAELTPADASADPHRVYAPYATPYSARNSFALFMLVVLNHVMDQRYGLSPAERREFRLLYGDPWFLVQGLLGHATRQMTAERYLAPVRHLQMEALLSAASAPLDGPVAGMDAVFARLAHEASGIQDIEAAMAPAAPAARPRFRAALLRIEANWRVLKAWRASRTRAGEVDHALGEVLEPPALPATLAYIEDTLESEDGEFTPLRTGVRHFSTYQAWHLLDFLLRRVDFPVNVVHGEEALGEADDWGYGPPHHLPADRVRHAAEALSGLTYDRLLDGVDPRDLTAAEIYPPGWEEPGALDWARNWFTGLTAYFEAAARDGHTVVVWLD